MYLFFDTETTGLPNNWKAPVTDLLNWPRIVQIAWILCDKKGAPIEEHSSIIKPLDFIIPDEVVSIHGISQESALTVGAHLNQVLDKFTMALNKSDLLVCHNIEFDLKVLTAELLRLESDFSALSNIPKICTMVQSTDYCSIPFPDGTGKKWPTLAELHLKLFGIPFEEKHNAQEDVRACMKCFFELRNRGIITIPDVVPT